jgi:hypothetical protein
MATTRRLLVEFDSAREATDGKGWKISWYDEDTAAVVVPVTTVEWFTRFSNSTRLSATITNKALTTNVATLTTAAPHNFVVGMNVYVTGVDAVFNGVYAIASTPSGTTFTYARTNANVTSVASGGTAQVPKLTALSATVTNKALTSNVVTLTTAGPHGYVVGDPITVSIADPTFDGTFAVASVPTSTTLTYAKTATNVSSVGASGTIVTEVSLVERAKALFNAATDVTGYFTAAATTALVAANSATIAANAAASLVTEGVA